MNQRMLQAAARAPLARSLNNQPHALLPNANWVPLASEAFYTWITQACLENGILPGPSQLGHLIRQLDATAHLSQRFQQINLRSVKSNSNSFTLDLDHVLGEVIELNADGWRVAIDFQIPFYRPDSYCPHLPPIKVKTKLPTAIEQLFHLDKEKARALTTWLIEAMLATQSPPALIITGKARIEAAEKLRGIIDPMICPLLAVPSTGKALGRLALTNRVMAFSIFKTLSPAKIEALNEIRTGMIVPLQQVNRRRDPIFEKVTRPIIVSAEEAIQIHDGQLTLEINQAQSIEKSEILGALLNAAVSAIRKMQAPKTRQVILELAAGNPIDSPAVILQPDEGLDP